MLSHVASFYFGGGELPNNEFSFRLMVLQSGNLVWLRSKLSLGPLYICIVCTVYISIEFI